MKNLKPVIKWTGSKRSQAEKIMEYIPNQIDMYYEPFVGGGSVLFKLLHSNKKVNKYVCSDLNQDLINFWNELKTEPQKLINDYCVMWNELNKDDDIERRKQYFYSIRKLFNTNRGVSEFLFLSRTCTNGLIRYNSKGEFNTSLHFTRPGIHPETFALIIIYWSNKLNEYNVEFKCQSYEVIKSSERDFIYLDPPYAATKGMYHGNIDLELFWEYLRKQKGDYILSFNGKSGEVDSTYAVPIDVYEQHIYLDSGVSSFKRIKEKGTQQVYESLYIKRGKGE